MATIMTEEENQTKALEAMLDAKVEKLRAELAEKSREESEREREEIRTEVERLRRELDAANRERETDRREREEWERRAHELEEMLKERDAVIEDVLEHEDDEGADDETAVIEIMPPEELKGEQDNLPRTVHFFE